MTFIYRLIATALMLAALGSASAQTDPAVDPPSRAARLSEFSGQVWLYNADSGEWVSAVRNRPITAGDRLATEAGARAEMQLGSTSVRLDSGTELEVIALDDERLSLQLISGSVTARVVDQAGAGLFDLSTDEGRFVVQRNGSYRFDREGGNSRISVYSGQARYEGPNSGLPVNPGQRAEFWIDSGGVAQYGLSAPVNDAFAAWNSDRDRRAVASVSARYVSPEMTGAEELDRYGRWEQNPEYGALWIPTAVAVDWAPYRSGHWAWVRPWGWTWVDDAPWGFAPFHYGRWVNVRSTWCWTPGVRVARPVYAPALVAWVGGPRANVSITIGSGPVGWFPLAPREVYVPSYRVSPRYAQNINITHVTNVTVINNVFNNPQGPREFDNRRWPGAVTVVPAAVMTSRQPVAPAAALMRQNPVGREFANQPAGARVATLIAPPVATPPVRSVDPRQVQVRPPPGFAERPIGARPGFQPPQQERDRDGRGRDVARPESPRTMPPAIQQPAPAAPIVAAPPMNPGAQQRPPIRLEDRSDYRRPGRDRIEAAPQTPLAAPAPMPAPVITRSVAPPPQSPQAQEAPMMRTQPVHRGEERRVEQPRPAQAPPVMNEPRPPRVERPAPVAAPAPAPRPVEPARPAEPQRVAPVAPPPEMRRPTPVIRNEQVAPEQKRGDPREQQR